MLPVRDGIRVLPLREAAVGMAIAAGRTGSRFGALDEAHWDSRVSDSVDARDMRVLPEPQGGSGDQTTGSPPVHWCTCSDHRGFADRALGILRLPLCGASRRTGVESAIGAIHCAAFAAARGALTGNGRALPSAARVVHLRSCRRAVYGRLLQQLPAGKNLSARSVVLLPFRDPH